MNFNVVDVLGFEKRLMKIAKKYPSSVELVETFFEELESSSSIEDLKSLGDHIPGYKLNGDRVYKSRMENPDANKSARAGFRIIWFLVTKENDIYPLTIYSKSDQEDISKKEVSRLIRALSIRSASNDEE
ncbi:hypothetical protein ABE073_03900 [Lederbergia citrisecunda]|uniref:hypothetical protein n=1 Tax=Lederbergia citrisecunda TaxID=2833583 RepID=UPI003D2B04EC